MKPLYLKYLLLVCLIGLHTCFTHAYTQTCPANLDFEMGDFTNWEFYKGKVTVVNGVNTINWSYTGVTPPPDNTVELISSSDTTRDSIGGFPRHCPNGSGYSIRLGDNRIGAQVDGISYTYAIPATATKFSILYNYAVVLESPDHPPEQQPRFRARIVNVATNEVINCVSFDFTASSSLPGFEVNGGRVYKGWTPVSVDLSSFAGQTIRLELITSDCTVSGHFGYAYVDVNAECSGNIKGNILCDGDTSLTLTAPFGFQAYEWYADASFSQLINTSQSLLLNTGTTPGSIIPVIVIPYPSFGCPDTLYAIIDRAAKPVSVAGADQNICNNQSVQIGDTTTAGYQYAWSPASLVNNAAIANPFTVAPFNTTTPLIVKTTDRATDCFSYDTVVITPRFVDTSTTFSGNLTYCPGVPLRTILLVNNNTTQVQWLRNSIPIAGGTSLVLQPGNTGNYQAQIKQDGCTDTSRLYTIRYTAQPRADFETDRPAYCMNMPAVFTNKTTITNNDTISYSWRFSDGSTQSSSNATKAFATTGIHNTTLIATSLYNCVDSIRKTIFVTTVCDPLVPSAFTPNGDGRNERFAPLMTGAKNLKRFAVYDRYGNVVFTTATENRGWDGTINGNAAGAGVYIWLLEYTDAANQPATRKGTVVLIR